MRGDIDRYIQWISIQTGVSVQTVTVLTGDHQPNASIVVVATAAVCSSLCECLFDLSRRTISHNKWKIKSCSQIYQLYEIQTHTIVGKKCRFKIEKS